MTSTSRLKPLLPRLVPTIVVVALLLWGSIALGMSELFAVRRPELALRFWPGHPGALARTALAVTTAPRPSEADKKRARARAIEAIVADPTQRIGFLVLGLLASNDAISAKQVSYAEALSRRDLAAQLYLVERAVRSDDIDGAIRHYDTALRTSQEARATLFPILSGAIDDDAIAAALGRVLARAPNWTVPYLDYAVQVTPDARNLLKLDTAVRRAGGNLPIATHGYLIARLARDGFFGEALVHYRALTGGLPTIRNSGFELEDRFFPVDWEYVTEPDLGAERVAGIEGRTNVLMVHALSGVTGVAARQLIALPVGRAFRLAYSSGGVTPGTRPPVLEVICARTNQVLAEGAFLAEGRTAIDGAPPGKDCPQQWLRVLVPATPIGDAVWLDDIAVKSR